MIGRTGKCEDKNSHSVYLAQHGRNSYLSYFTSNFTGCLLNIRPNDRFFLSMLTLKTSL